MPISLKAMQLLASNSLAKFNHGTQRRIIGTTETIFMENKYNYKSYGYNFMNFSGIPLSVFII